MLETNTVQKEIAKLAQMLSYREWLKVCGAVTRAFEEKERSARKELKADAERITYYLNNK